MLATTHFNFERRLRQGNSVEGVGYIVDDCKSQRQPDPQSVEQEVEEQKEPAFDARMVAPARLQNVNIQS